MTASTISTKGKRIGTALLAAAFWLLVWQGISLLVAQELLVPAPLQVARTLGQLAVLTVRFRAADVLLSPLLKIVRAAPVASFIILALVWIRTNTLPAFIAFLMVVPVVWGNVEKGIRETDAGLLEMAKVYRLGWWKTLVRVRIPSVMPYFLAAATTGLGFAWKSGIAAEVICRPAMSIGRQLQDAKVYLETPEVFAWTAVVVALSMVLEKGLLLAVRRLKRYNTGGEGDGA